MFANSSNKYKTPSYAKNKHIWPINCDLKCNLTPSNESKIVKNKFTWAGFEAGIVFWHPIIVSTGKPSRRVCHMCVSRINWPAGFKGLKTGVFCVWLCDNTSGQLTQSCMNPHPMQCIFLRKHLAQLWHLKYFLYIWSQYVA